jgi:CheY-like chemotaxis protein
VSEGRSPVEVYRLPTILMIDDGLIALTARKKLLERADYSVLAATDGESGLRLFESNPLDLVLMDYYMPRWRNRKLASG